MNSQDNADAERHRQEQEEQQMTNLATALVKARKNIHNPPLDGKNPHFNNRFSTLKACLDAVVPAFLDEGIVIVQDFISDNNQCICQTRLIHESGETMVFLSPAMTPQKTGPQEWASLSTYARRYGLMGVGSIVGDDDDDGNKASESAFGNATNRTKTRNKIMTAAEAGEDELVRDLMGELDNDQKAELWGTLSKPQKVLINESKVRLSKKETPADA